MIFNSPSYTESARDHVGHQWRLSVKNPIETGSLANTMIRKSTSGFMFVATLGRLESSVKFTKVAEKI